MEKSDDPPRLQLPPGLLLILAAPVAVFILLEFVLKSLGDPTLTLSDVALADGAQLLELTGRYRFLAAFAFFGAVSLAVLAIFALDLLSNYTRRTAIACGVAVLACAAVGLVYSVMEPAALGAFETRYLLGRGFFESALGQGGVGLCAAGGDCPDGGGLYVLRKINDAINSVTSFSLAAAMIGLILALAGRDPGAKDSGDRAVVTGVAELKAGRAVSQRYLYCAGLLLTSGITFLIAWTRWPADMIADATLKQQYLDLTSALTLYVGVGYSVLILSAYLPVIVILANRAERLRYRASLPPPPGDPEEAPAPVEVPDLNYLDALKSIAAILSPVLASAIGTFGQGTLFQ